MSQMWRPSDSDVSPSVQIATQPASSTPEIPHELVSEILEHLEDDKLALCAVSLSSTILRNEAQIILFRNVTVLLTEDKASRQFLRTITASPSRLALLVRAYRIEGIDVTRELSDMIREGLLAMQNLKRLDLCFLGDVEVESPDGPATLLRGCTFKLETFRWESYPEDAPELINTFLPGQDTLKHIRMTFFDAIPPDTLQLIDSSIRPCPQLVSLVATWDVINILLSGDKITKLTVVPRFTLPSGGVNIILNSLAPALKHLKVLSCCFHTVYEEKLSLEHILLHCPSLVILELGVGHEEKILMALPKLRGLHTLVLSRPRSPLFFAPLPAKQVKELVRRVFDNSSMNLEEVDVNIGMETYERYTRSRGEGDLIPRASLSEVGRYFAE